MVPAGWCLATPLQSDRLQTEKKPQSPGKQKTRKRRKINASGSRSGGIRTRGLLVPNQTRYQTALHLDAGADEGTRTPDLLITNRLLYQLSHIGTTSKLHCIKEDPVCPAFFLIRFFRCFREHAKSGWAVPVSAYSPGKLDTARRL